MIIEKRIPLLEEILSQWQETIGKDYQGYKNHVYRMIHCCFALKNCNEEERHKIIIAAAFHDIGIWTNKTVDYISPSISPAMQYLNSQNLHNWSTEIKLMIAEHHKIKHYKNDAYPLVEIFRKGDLIDFSLGLFRFGIPKNDLQKLKTQFPNAGFHKNLSKLAIQWFVRHPLNPVPMMKW
jgi:hypothetical protein